MRRADRIGGALLLVFGVWFSAVAVLRYRYWSSTGPGSGFFPFWLGVAMAVLAALLLIRAVRERDPGPGWLPRGGGLGRLVLVVAATAVFIAIMPAVGMTLGTAVFLALLLRALERHSWPVTLGVAVGAAFVNWLVFIYWLRVPLPAGVLGF